MEMSQIDGNHGFWARALSFFNTRMVYPHFQTSCCLASVVLHFGASSLLFDAKIIAWAEHHPVWLALCFVCVWPGLYVYIKLCGQLENSIWVATSIEGGACRLLVDMIVTLSLAVGCSYAADQLEGNGPFIGVLCVLAAISLLEMGLLEERDFVLADSVFSVSAGMAVTKFKKPLHVTGVISMYCIRKVSVFILKKMVAARELAARELTVARELAARELVASTQLEALENQLAAAKTDIAVLERKLAAAMEEIAAKEVATRKMAEVMEQAAIKQKADVDAS